MKAGRISIFMLLGFIAIAANLFRMQVFRGEYYYTLADKNRIRILYLEAPRGKILDRNNELLATNRLSFNCSAIPREAKSHIQRSCGIVAPILKIDPLELAARFKKKKPGAFNTVLIAEDITPAQAMSIEEKLDLLPGFLIETRPRREYPPKEAVAHLAGYIGPMTERETDLLEDYGYRAVDWVGRDGVEKVYESYLRGHSGGLQLEVDNRGRYVRALGVKEPKEGKDIQLTIDGKLQSYVQRLLENKKGAVIVMDLKEGGLLSANSAPSFDPNLFASAGGRKLVGKYLHNSQAPMMNRGIRGQYPPGSIFKIVTALAAMKHHGLSPNKTVNCGGRSVIGGRVFRCWKEAGHGPQALSQAFAHSCDVYFYAVGLATGIDPISQEAIQFGFSKITGVDLPGEKGGLVPSRDWKRKAFHSSWFDGDTANLAIGQGFLQTTPIQDLVMIAAVATEGEIYRPHLIDKIEGVRVAERHTTFLDIPVDRWKKVKAGLHEAVNSESGTGRLARVEGVRIAGKTGTAETGQGKTHAWFVGYAPEDDPKIAMVVFLEHGGHGGIEAASLSGNIFRWLKEAAYL